MQDQRKSLSDAQVTQNWERKTSEDRTKIQNDLDRMEDWDKTNNMQFNRGRSSYSEWQKHPSGLPAPVSTLCSPPHHLTPLPPSKLQRCWCWEARYTLLALPTNRS